MSSAVLANPQSSKTRLINDLCTGDQGDIALLEPSDFRMRADC
jgi:hypothetical protein